MIDNKEENIVNNIITITKFLKINPNDIDDIKELATQSECHIYIKMKRRPEICLFCHSENLEIKEWKERKIKHALFHSKVTTFYVKSPRYVCKDCKKTFTGYNCFSLPHSRITHELVYLVLKSLMEYNQTNASVAKTFNISPTAVREFLINM